jgi:hypothetical protein
MFRRCPRLRSRRQNQVRGTLFNELRDIISSQPKTSRIICYEERQNQSEGYKETTTLSPLLLLKTTDTLVTTTDDSTHS